MLRSLSIAAAAVAATAQPYWWKYAGYDAPNMDIKHIDGASVQDLEYACGNLTGCVAFNTDGWLKNSTTNMQSGQPCDLYVKNSTPQPAPPVYNGVLLWPMPVNITTGNTTLVVAGPVTFTATTPSADLTAAFGRFTAQIFKHASPAASADVIAKLRSNGAVTAETAAAEEVLGAAATLSTVTVSVANVNVPLQLGVDESYTLVIPADGSPATLTAATVYGAYMGLQTFSQLVVWNASLKQYTVPTAPVTISDAPRFAWRGVLIDTDRHWQSLPHIYKVIDSIVMTKMNTLHWHIVDWQSWPLESAAYPKVWDASWSELERYTFEDVSSVVEYGRQRGVRVVMEFDTPGHAGSLCIGYPEVCPSPTCTMPLNPASPDTLTLINAVLKELVALAPDTYFHLGGDEVNTDCWTNTPAIVAWMAAQNPPLTADTTYEYFVSKVDQMALDLNRVPVRWEEVWKHFGTQLDPRTIIHVWLSSATMIDVVNNGYRGVWSVDGLYYLDDLTETAASFYNVDILGGITNVTAQQLVLGGEVEMWGETVDGSEIESTIWPRAAAAAERWWSYDVTGNDFTAAGVAERFSWFRCQMLDNGVASAPTNNANARTGPPGPGSCFAQ